MKRVAAEQDNLHAALEWAVAHERDELALRLASGQVQFWERRGRFGEARTGWSRRWLPLRPRRSACGLQCSTTPGRRP